MLRVPHPDTVIVAPCASPRVSVLLLAFRRPALPDAVAALVRSTHATDYEVRVLLNGASAEVANAVKERLVGAHIDSSHVNLGFSAGVNRLAAHSRAEYLAVLNDDTLVCDGWLDELVKAADELPDAALISSRLVFPDGRLQEAGCRLEPNGDGIQVGWGQPDTDPALHTRRDIDYGSAAAVLLRREAFAEVGGFDEAFFPAYYEDVDLALRLRAAGWRVVYEPRAIVEHEQWGSTTAGERQYSNAYNRERFEQRWGALFDSSDDGVGAGSDDAVEDSSDDAVGAGSAGGRGDGPIQLPPGSVTRVVPEEFGSPWQHYAQWLLEQLAQVDLRVTTLRELDERCARLQADNEQLRTAHSELAEFARRASETAEALNSRVQLLEAERDSIRATKTWRAHTKLTELTAAVQDQPLLSRVRRRLGR